MKRLTGLVMGVGSAVVPAVCMAADVPFTVTAPTFDWSTLGTVATSMLAVAVGIAVYRRVRSMVR